MDQGHEIPAHEEDDDDIVLPADFAELLQLESEESEGGDENDDDEGSISFSTEGSVIRNKLAAESHANFSTAVLAHEDAHEAAQPAVDIHSSFFGEELYTSAARAGPKHVRSCSDSLQNRSGTEARNDSTVETDARISARWRGSIDDLSRRSRRRKQMQRGLLAKEGLQSEYRREMLKQKMLDGVLSKDEYQRLLDMDKQAAALEVGSLNCETDLSVLHICMLAHRTIWLQIEPQPNTDATILSRA